MGKDNANMERVRILMKECAPNRRVWIKTDVPKVKDVQEEFPPLCDPDTVNLQLHVCVFINFYDFLCSCTQVIMCM